jgi:hypothetical protein
MCKAIRINLEFKIMEFWGNREQKVFAVKSDKQKMERFGKDILC